MSSSANLFGFAVVKLWTPGWPRRAPGQDSSSYSTVSPRLHPIPKPILNSQPNRTSTTTAVAASGETRSQNCTVIHCIRTAFQPSAMIQSSHTMPSPREDDSSEPKPTFHLFPRLPPELRLKIWQLFISPRYVPLVILLRGRAMATELLRIRQTLSIVLPLLARIQPLIARKCLHCYTYVGNLALKG